MGELYDLNIVIMKRNGTLRNLKYSGDAIFQNLISCFLLKYTGSALKCSETQVRGDTAFSFTMYAAS